MQQCEMQRLLYQSKVTVQIKVRTKTTEKLLTP